MKKNASQGEKGFFHKWCWQNWTSTGQKINSNIIYIFYTKVNSKWTRSLNTKFKNNTFRKKYEKIFKTGLGKKFLSTIPKAQFIEEKFDKLDFIKITEFL